MPRRPRLDDPGAWHHVMNRGVAKRTLFEGRSDIRFFLSRIARAVRSGGIEIHAFCVMMTHFHILVRSPQGRLSDVMRQVQLDYVRRFNRSRHRDGPLVRGRFGSKPVLSLAYRRILVRYIDRNPVAAGICARASEYPFGSAVLYRRQVGPPWLERSWVEKEVCGVAGKEAYEPADYARAFGATSELEVRLVERRIESQCHSDALDDLLGSIPNRVLAWMRWKARLADGTEPGLPVVAGECVDDVVGNARTAGLEALLPVGRSDPLLEIHAGLLRDLAGAPLAEIAHRLRRSTSNAGQLCTRYAHRIEESEAYAQHAGRLAREALSLQHGSASSAPTVLDIGSRRS